MFAELKPRSRFVDLSTGAGHTMSTCALYFDQRFIVLFWFFFCFFFLSRSVAKRRFFNEEGAALICGHKHKDL